jgi:hypothetical protein
MPPLDRISDMDQNLGSNTDRAHCGSPVEGPHAHHQCRTTMTQSAIETIRKHKARVMGG